MHPVRLYPATLSNPLRRMEIRFDGLQNAGGLRTVNGARFGMVRNAGKRPHQGIDLYAIPGTPVYAVSDGEVVRIRRHHPAYGQDILLRFQPEAKLAARLGLSGVVHLFALYAHLSAIHVHLGRVSRGQYLGDAGISGNADQHYPHLHFEIRTKQDAGLGLHNRLNPELIFSEVDYSKPVEALESYRRTA